MIIDLLPLAPESYVRNCLISPRLNYNSAYALGNAPFDGCMFYNDGKSVYARLDGYAIVPREEYEKLKNSHPDLSLQSYRLQRKV
jgi:hypothetical protein